MYRTYGVSGRQENTLHHRDWKHGEFTSGNQLYDMAEVG